jgi:ribosomal protein S18 acetylase RimI-like enzyme
MAVERTFLVAEMDSLLIAEPTLESRPVLDTDLRDVAQTLVDASASNPRSELSLDMANAYIMELLSGTNGEPHRPTWLGVWEGQGPPVSVVLCTLWRGMPYIATVASAPKVQNRGYASSLVREAASIFDAAGSTHVGLSLELGSPALHLFNELGFKEMFSTASL